MGKLISNISKGAYNTYKYAAESAGKIAREIKLKAQMADNKSQIKELYQDIGKNVYEKYLLKEKIDIDSDFATDCSMIDILADEIEEIRMEILSLKQLKQCPKCNYEIELDYHYCPNCGTEQELSKEDKENDGPATLETTDNIDRTLKRKQNNNSEGNIQEENNQANNYRVNEKYNNVMNEEHTNKEKFVNKEHISKEKFANKEEYTKKAKQADEEKNENNEYEINDESNKNYDNIEDDE